MAAAPSINQHLANPNELADEAEVEALETQEQPPVQESPAPQQEPPKQEEEPEERTVTYKRFKQLLDQNQQHERELAEHREFRARLDERQKIIEANNQQQQRIAAQQREAQMRPDPAMDPIGAQLYDMQQASARDRATIEQLHNQLQQFGQNYQSTQEQTQFSNWVTAEANSYAAAEADYFPAARYAADRRVEFWRTVAPNAPQGVAEKLVEGESLLIARLAAQYGGKFAPAIHKLARDWGFSSNGVPAQRQAAAPPRSAQAQRLQQVSNGQRLQGLSAVPTGGSAQNGAAYRNYSALDIANMSEPEFAAAMANPQIARDLQYALAKADGLEGADVRY